jgi:DNA-binding PadR family transcriptional regulator
MSGDMLSDVELTILSLVAESPRYGAEIEQVIELRGLREWLTVGSASIYYILNRLEQQELLTRAHQPDGEGGEQIIYQITDAGRGVVQTAVSDLLRRPRTLGQGFALGLANMGVLKSAQVYQKLVQHRDDLTHQLQSAETVWARRQREEMPSDGTQALYSHGIAVMRAELDWLTGYIDDWLARHPVVERDDSHETDDSTQTPLHRRTASADRDKQIQRLKRPKDE